MTNRRVQAPPVNLKERIAALQQRNVSPGPRPTSPSPVPATIPNSAGLRDKIAKFERKGGIPVPRGSFGLGAPPPPENGPERRRGELYGNRIPGTVRGASGGGPATSRSNSPFESVRSFSLSALEKDDLDEASVNAPSLSPPPSPYLGSSVEHAGSSRQQPRGTAFATALDLARKAESGSEHLSEPLDAPASLSIPSQYPVHHADGAGDDYEPQSQESPPAIIISPDDVSSSSPEPEAFSLPSVPKLEAEVKPFANEVESQPELPPVQHLEDPAHSQIPLLEPSPIFTENSDVDNPSIPTTQADVSLGSNHIQDGLYNSEDAANVEEVLPSVTLPSPDGFGLKSQRQVDIPHEINMESNSPEDDTADDTVKLAETEESPAPADVVTGNKSSQSQSNNDSPSDSQDAVACSEPQVPEVQSPAGPLTLADAVFELGQVVANIQNLFPDQVSPLATPPAYRSLHIDSSTDDGIRSHSRESSVSRDKSKKTTVDLTIQLDNPSAIIAAGSQPDPVLEDSQSAGPHSITRSNEMIAPVIIESPSEVLDSLTSSDTSSPTSTRATLSTPASDQSIFLNTPSIAGRPMSMIETSPSHVAQAHRMTPLTSRGVSVFVSASQRPQNFEHFPPTPDQEEFGTVSVHKSSHSFSHARTYVSHGRNVQDQDTRKSSFSAVVHTKVTELSPSASAPAMPQTPQMNRTKRSQYGEVPQSPGFGELAALLQSAALLEETLEKGELPSEDHKRETLNMRVQKAKAETKTDTVQEKELVESITKPNIKHDELETKSKHSFRNPLSRNKAHGRDESGNEAQTPSSRDSTRVKSVLSPYQPHGSLQASHSRQSLLSDVLETCDEVLPMETAPHHTSSKSPRQYLAGLRRLASTSRSSTASSGHARHSVSTSSEISSEDSSAIVMFDRLDSASITSGSTNEVSQTGYWNGSGITWPSLSPKKSPGSVSRAATFAGKMWPRGRTKSNISTNSAYDAIDRITQPATKSVAATLPPLDPMSFSLEVPTVTEAGLPSPIEPLVSPRRSASLHATSTSQFPPVYTPLPTSPVYTPFTAPAPRFESISQSLHVDSLIPVSEDTKRPSSWVSVGSTSSSIPSPLFDSFPAVPNADPLHHVPGFSHAPRPPLPPSLPSFFEAAPISSTPVGSEFVPSQSPFVRSATTSTTWSVPVPPQMGMEHHR